MPDNIDERIVQMQFDNQRFERNISTSINSIEALKKGLNFDGSIKSLSELDRAGKAFSLAGIAQGVDAIANKFTALGIVGVTALQNIVNSAVNAGKRIVSALTIDPISTGFQEYETKMNAIQTILTNTASKGTTIQDVNDVLAELNTYADMTIYNFAEMTRNIGTFTAAGIDLERSAVAIKGIANLAAGSGSNAQQASTAMYQLSQALAAGSVKLMDWNSVVNAGMGGELFQNALKNTAKEMGVVVDQSVPFRLSLEKGWLSSEVLIKTLEKLANDPSLTLAATQVKTFTQLFDTMKESVQSGWAVSWEKVIGDKEEAAKTLTAINDAFSALVGPIEAARNEALTYWHDYGGRDILIKALTNAFEGLQTVMRPLKEAFRDFFPPITGMKLVEFTHKFSALMKDFKIGETTALDLKRTFKGFFAILDIGRQAFSAIWKGLVSLIEYFIPAGKGILSFTGSIGDFLVALDEAIKSSDTFNVVVEKIGNILRPIGDFIKGLASGIKEAFKAIANADMSGLDSIGEKIKARFGPLGDMIKGFFFKLGEGLNGVAPVFYKIAGVLGKVFGAIQDRISASLDTFNFDGLFDLINGGLFAAILVGIKKFTDSLSDIAGKSKGIVAILDGIKGCLAGYQAQLKAGALLKIAGAIAILAASLLVLSLIDSKKLTGSMAAMTAIFADLVGSMFLLDKITGKGVAFKMQGLAVAMVTLSIAILILSTAMSKLAKLDWGEIARGSVGIVVLTGSLVAAAKILSTSTGKLIKGSVGLIAFATAILIMAQAVKNLSALNWEELSKGLLGITVILANIVVMTNTIGSPKRMISVGIGMIAIGAAMLIFAEAVKRMGQLQWDEIGRGLTVLAGALAAVTIAVNFMPSGMVGKATGMVLMGAALLIIGKAMVTFGAMQWDEIGRGLTVMAGALAAVVLAMNFLPKNMLTSSIGLIGVAAALTILAGALQTMGGMTWPQIAQGLVLLAGSLGIIALAMNFMTGALPGAAALLVIAASLAILAPVLGMFGNMSLAEIGKSLLMLVGVFAIFGVAALLLAPLTPVLLGLGVAIALLGVGVAAIGGGLLAFSAGLSALAVSGTAGAVALVAVITSLVGLIPLVFTQIGEGIIALAGVIGTAGPALLVAFTAIFTALIGALMAIIPQAVEAVFLLLTSILQTIAARTPELMQAGMDIIVGFLRGIADNIEDVVEAGTDIIINFIKGVADKIPDVIQSGFDLVLSFVNGLADAMRNNAKPVADAIENLILSMISSATTIILDPIKGILSVAGNIVDGLVEGIKGKITDAVNAAKNLGSAIITGLKDFLGIESPSTVARDEVGAMVDAGVAEGITENKTSEQAAEKKAQAIIDAFKRVFETADLKSATAGLEQQLWMALGGANSPKSQQIAVGVNTLQTQIALQQQKVDAAKAQYEQMFASLGANNNKTIEAYNTYLQEQIDLAKMVEDLKKLQASAASSSQDSAKAYYDYIIAHSEELKAQGYTQEQINALASQATGFYPNGVAPVVDMTPSKANIGTGTGGVTVSAARGISAAVSAGMAAAASARQTPSTETPSNNGSTPAQTSYSFTQNNYSPKPLSRIEIYRQTKNQVLAARGLVTNS